MITTPRSAAQTDAETIVVDPAPGTSTAPPPDPNPWWAAGLAQEPLTELATRLDWLADTLEARGLTYAGRSARQLAETVRRSAGG